MAQVVERVLGKDEVGSSSLPSSSKIPLIFQGIFCFAADRFASVGKFLLLDNSVYIWYTVQEKGEPQMAKNELYINVETAQGTHRIDIAHDEEICDAENFGGRNRRRDRFFHDFGRSTN